MLSRMGQFYQTSLSAHITPYSATWQMRYHDLKQSLTAKGMSLAQADQTALTMIYGTVRRQAGALSFNYIFWVIGIAFLSIIPLLLLLKRPSNTAEPGPLH
jgi:DHA2 family multidrug resistance protein